MASSPTAVPLSLAELHRCVVDESSTSSRKLTCCYIVLAKLPRVMIADSSMFQWQESSIAIRSAWLNCMAVHAILMFPSLSGMGINNLSCQFCFGPLYALEKVGI